MLMQKLKLAAVMAAGLILASSASALADVETNPNVGTATDVTCANGFSSDTLLLVGRTGHVPSGGSGVATSVYLLNVAPEPVEVFNVPGEGLPGVTTWCEWSQDGLLVGGDILLRGNLR